VRDATAPHVVTRLVDVLDDLRLVVGDATDPELLAPLVRDVDAVFPFAGHSGAARSLQEPFPDLVLNAGGQLAVLEELRQHNPEARVVFPGSRLQYGRAATTPVREDHPQEPTSLYGLHKLIGERYHLLYHDLYAIPTCVLRISIPYGPHQDRPDRAFGVVGNFLATAAREGEIAVWGDGSQRRDYVYVDDLIDLVILAASHPAAPGQVFNAGGPVGVSIKEMAETVVRTVGRGRVIHAPWPPLEAAVETGDHVSDLSHAREMLGWQPRTHLDGGLALTWAVLQSELARTG